MSDKENGYLPPKGAKVRPRKLLNKKDILLQLDKDDEGGDINGMKEDGNSSFEDLVKADFENQRRSERERRVLKRFKANSSSMVSKKKPQKVVSSDSPSTDDDSDSDFSA